MAAPYILARTLGEAHAFAQDELGVGRGYYRVVTSPSSIKGPRGADLYLVPGWRNRHDRFAMISAIRWTRLNKIDVVEWRAEQAEPAFVVTAVPDDTPVPQHHLDMVKKVLGTSEPDGLEPAGEQMHLDGTETPAAEPTEEQAPAEEPKPQRRRRCKECGILVDPDEVEQHAAEHLPEEV